MKTNIFFSRNAALYSLIGFLSLLVASCGSYQNSSYYDTDGVYGNSPRESRNISSNRYKEYFSSLQTENNTNDTIEKFDQEYPGWGNNPSTTSINIYTNPWNMGFGMGWGNGFGWGDPFFGMGWGGGFGWGSSFGMGWGAGFGWGWGYPVWGWGNPGWGWNNNFYGNGYGYNNNYSYNPSRRGSSYPNRVSGNSRYSQNSTYTNNRGANYSDTRRNAANGEARNSSLFINRDYSRSQNNSTPSENNLLRSTRTNTNTNSSRTQNTAPTRTNNNNSNSNMNYGGGRSSGDGGSYSGGGGRSTGGGGGGRPTGGSGGRR